MDAAAELGFSVRIEELEKAVVALQKISSESKSANASAKSIGASMSAASKVFAGAVAGMNQGILTLVTSSKSATVEQIAAAKQASDYANKIYKAASAQEKLATSVNKATNAIKKEAAAIKTENSLTSILTDRNKTASTINSYQQSASDKQINRFNTANIAAQFQDIGVTAAMGMNPLTIGLQQGTQLSAILNMMVDSGEKGAGALKTLGEAFKSIINPLSLTTIGLTALLAAGIQMVDWTSVAQSGLNGLASVMDFAAAGFETVSKYSDVLTVSLTTLAGSMAFFNRGAIFTWLTGLPAMFNNGITAIKNFGSSAVSAFTNFIKGLNPLTIKITLVVAAITLLYVGFKKFEDEIKAFFNSDLGKAITSAVNAMIGSFTAGFEAIAAGGVWVYEKIKSLWNDKEGPAEGLMERMNSAVDKALKRDYIGKVGEVAGKAGNVVNDLATEGLSKVSDMFQRGASAARDFAKSLGEDSKEAEKLKNKWADLQNQMQQTKAGLELEGRTIGLGTYESTLANTNFDLLNRTKEAGISITPEVASVINEASESTARLTAENEKLADSFNTAKSITHGFFSDMRSSLWEGRSAWESFGNAVTNVLDRILDKMLDIGVNSLFDAFGTMGTQGGSSKFSWRSVASSISSWFGGITSNAKGGAYTNGIVDSPTLFAFAKGGSFGVMGEAGPEAIMPLTRGPDGSLGVKAEGVGSAAPVVVNVYNNSNAQANVNQRQTSQGTEIDVMIDQMIADKMSQPGTSSNSALTAFSNRRLITR